MNNYGYFFVNLNEFSKKSSAEYDNIWNFYFNSAFRGEPTQHCHNCIPESGKGQYYLEECIFSNDQDGVINFTGISNTLFLHNRCSFSNCTSTKSAGCIFYQPVSSSSIVQRKFCCTKCQSQGSSVHFSFARADKDKLNFVIESSLFDVGNESVGYSTIYARYGAPIVSSTNFSSCKALSSSVGEVSSHFPSLKSKINYTTVVNNLATFSSGCIIYIYDNSLLESCNIINNTKTESKRGIIYHNSWYLTIKSCSFINNTFPEDSYLIYNNNQLTVESCYIDNSIPKAFYRKIVTYYPRGLFTNKLIHLSPDICHAEFEIINISIDIDNELPLFFIALVNTENSL